MNICILTPPTHYYHFYQGVPYSLSSDNLLLSGDHDHAPSPTAELLHLVHDVGLGWEAATQSIMSGLRASFSPAVTQQFIDNIRRKITDLSRN